ncbi:carbohydrate kinase [Leptospira kanakyensis]|uniref:Carbohydrate kinase n=1 Tax=Leptospira kanakyensis TaxID=2484968 RepID=A0A6N4Q8U0_9LEPT|nr:FGGY-family carbohydrate kinase [Leptospira kanakyensis]TGK47682.1 carbohydrate kinase [Leptospira kanakyensis]TGK63315.1 carbohydrate kinase [Leptospira kanakyensis]TGK66922.1 carbohydrate kinase [Leptospira kanakyensis]
MESEYILTYDIGTTGVKTCLFRMTQALELVQSATKEYSIQLLENGGAEQNPEDWWSSMKDTTAQILTQSKIHPDAIQGISFCSQMQGLVLTDSKFQAVRPAMSYMDQRATREMKQGIVHGFKIEGINAIKLLLSLWITGAVAASVKDPIWKYKWVEKNEPEVFSKVKWWFDVKEYLIARSTNEAVMTRDSAFATFLYNSRVGKGNWSPLLCKLFGVRLDHLPKIVNSSDRVGGLTKEAAEYLGLKENIAVFGGGGDASLIGVGAGAVSEGDTHIYAGTSGWIATVTKKRTVDIGARIASIVGAREGFYNFFGEQETSGKCLQWVRDHLALDEIDLYLEKKKITDGPDAVYESLFEFMFDSIKDTEPGSHGVIFTPWLHGNRCPFEDPKARGIFFNISLNTGKRTLIRSVVEGILFHKRWILELSHRKVPTSDTIRFVGGVARSGFICQLLADITGKTIERVVHPENVGAMGAAAIVAFGIGKIQKFEEIKSMIPIQDKWIPNPNHKEIYDKNFKVFQNLYKVNQNNFAILNT